MNYLSNDDKASSREVNANGSSPAAPLATVEPYVGSRQRRSGQGRVSLCLALTAVLVPCGLLLSQAATNPMPHPGHGPTVVKAHASLASHAVLRSGSRARILLANVLPSPSPSVTPSETPTETPTPECDGQESETLEWTTHAQFLGWKCDANGLNFDSSPGAYDRIHIDPCGVTTHEPGTSHLEWADIRVVNDENGSHEEYNFVEIDDQGNLVRRTGWLTPDRCCPVTPTGEGEPTGENP